MGFVSFLLCDIFDVLDFDIMNDDIVNGVDVIKDGEVYFLFLFIV